MADELERRIESLERIISASGLGRVGHLDGSYRIVVCDADGDGNMNPLTSTSYDGDAFNDGATGTINWNADFGVPPGGKAVYVHTQVRDSDSPNGFYKVDFYAKATTPLPSFKPTCPRTGANHIGVDHGWIPAAQDGTSYYDVTASGVGTLDLWIRVVAYAR